MKNSAKERLENIKDHFITNIYTMEQVSQHTSEDDCWVVINGEVIDATSFILSHPGITASNV